VVEVTRLVPFDAAKARALEAAAARDATSSNIPCASRNARARAKPEG
jgi:hypothetical protein